MSRLTHCATRSGSGGHAAAGVFADDDLGVAEEDNAGREQLALGVADHLAAPGLVHPGHGRIGRSQVDADGFFRVHCHIPPKTIDSNTFPPGSQAGVLRGVLRRDIGGDATIRARWHWLCPCSGRVDGWVALALPVFWRESPLPRPFRVSRNALIRRAVSRSWKRPAGAMPTLAWA